MNKLTPTQKAYIAGLVDADGCIGVSKKKQPGKARPLYYIRVIVTNSHFPTVCWIKELTGVGCAHRTGYKLKANWSPVHRWQVTCNQARDVIKAIRPFLMIKADVADLVMQMPVGDFRGGRADEIVEKQTEVYERSIARNMRGNKTRFRKKS